MRNGEAAAALAPQPPRRNKMLPEGSTEAVAPEPAAPAVAPVPAPAGNAAAAASFDNGKAGSSRPVPRAQSAVGNAAVTASAGRSSSAPGAPSMPNPYAATPLEDAWRMGFDAGSAQPNEALLPPSPLTPDGRIVYSEGGLAGQDAAKGGGPPAPAQATPGTGDVALAEEAAGSSTPATSADGAKADPDKPGPGDASDRVQIEAALCSKDVSDVKHIRNFGAASEAEKFQLIAILLDQAVVGPFDEYALEAIWRSFGDRVIAVASAHLNTWNACIDCGAELEDLPQVVQIMKQFTADIRAIVADNLFRNRKFVISELQRMGLELTEEAVLTQAAPDQANEVQDLQLAATIVAKLQKAQEDVRGKILVGYEPAPPTPADPGLSGMLPGSTPPLPNYIPSFFNQNKPPTFANYPLNFGEPPWKVTPYAEVKQKYDEVSAHIRFWLTAFPALYGIARQNKSEETQHFADRPDPAAARQELGTALRALIRDIEGAQVKLDSGDLNPLDLTPVQARLFAGTGPSGVEWQAALPNAIGKKLVEGHDFSKILIEFGFQAASQVLFLLAPLTGGASLFVALAGVEVLREKADRSAEEFAMLDQASKTSILPDTELVTQGQVDRAKEAMDADKAAFALAALTVAAGAVLEGAAALGGKGNASSELAQQKLPAIRSLVQGEAIGRAGVVPPGLSEPPWMELRIVSVNQASGDAVVAGRSAFGETALLRVNLNTGDGVTISGARSQTVAGWKLQPARPLLGPGVAPPDAATAEPGGPLALPAARTPALPEPTSDMLAALEARGIPGTPGTVTGGSSQRLGRNLMRSFGLPAKTSFSGWQPHHIIPTEAHDHPVIVKIGMSLDDASNGIMLPEPGTSGGGNLPTHKGYHSLFSDVALAELDKMDVTLPTSELHWRVFDLQQRLRRAIIEGTPLYYNKGGTVPMWQSNLAQPVPK